LAISEGRARLGMTAAWLGDWIRRRLGAEFSGGNKNWACGSARLALLA
jgi:hypothetical protein